MRDPVFALGGEQTRYALARDAKWACKPGSVENDHLSRNAVASVLKHATRAQCGPHHSAPICACSERGLPSRRVATTLVVSYTTVSAFLSPAKAGSGSLLFCGAFRRVAPPGR